MRIEDVGSRAGEDLRARFADEYAPALPWELVSPPERRTYMSRAALVVAGVMVVVVATTLAFAISDARHPTASGSTGPMWQRVSMAKAFGPNVTMGQIAGGADGFVAAGSVPHRCPGSVPLWACESQFLWRSSDGVRWSRVPFPALSAAQADVAVGVNHGVYVLIRQREQDAGVWRSTDGRTWAKAATLNLRGRVSDSRGPTPWIVSSRGRGFVATRRVFDEHGGLQSWRSRDGRHWIEIRGGSARAPVGLPIAARIGSTYFAFDDWLSATSGAAKLWRSRDGIHWQRSRGGPMQFHSRITTNRSESVGVGSQFRVPGEGPQSAGLFRTHTGSTWNEISSFRERYPTASPYAIARNGHWWVVSGTTATPGPHGVDRQRTSVWVSRDLRHWIEMPSAGRGRGAPGQLAESRDRVVAVPLRGAWIRIWKKPNAVPTLSTVTGRPSDTRPPCCKQGPNPVGQVMFETSDARTVSALVFEPGRFVIDLPPGSYRMRGSCGDQAVNLGSTDVTVTCQLR